jgi:dTDP-3,4-didehydro-2,6-dideoxy-alpha-D-glucose 3-reductase
MTGPLRIGVLGCADIARRRMLPAMVASPDLELVAVASRHPDKARVTARQFGCRATHGYDRLLSSEDIDAVYIPLPAALHAAWVRRALAEGKHVLAEKPLTTELLTTCQLLYQARRDGLVLMENVMFVQHSQHAAVRELVADGRIGSPRSFHAVFTTPRLSRDNIRLRPELGGGALWDLGLYPLRAAMHFLGADLTVVGAILAVGEGQRVDTSGAALLRAAGGVAAHLSFGLDHDYVSAYTLHGSEGRISVDRAFTPPADHVPVVRVDNGSHTELMRLEPDDQVANTLAAFVAAVHAGAGPSSDCLRQAELLDDVRNLACQVPRDRNSFDQRWSTHAFPAR